LCLINLPAPVDLLDIASVEAIQRNGFGSALFTRTNSRMARSSSRTLSKAPRRSLPALGFAENRSARLSHEQEAGTKQSG
jgi:hypothetical protein